MFRRALPVLLLLTACSADAPQTAAVDPLDEDLAAAGRRDSGDPLLMSVLGDPLMTDPQLSTRANANSVRPPGQPYGAPLPAVALGRIEAGEPAAAAPAPSPCTDCRAATQALTLAALAAEQRDPALSACVAQWRYTARWAVRLPADLPLPADARVIEAAGAAGPVCSTRAVSYVALRPLARVIDAAYARSTAAGYRVEHQSDGTRHILRGTRTRDGGAFLLVASARDDDTADVTLLANNGR
ncbi:hypothetical protein SAMN06297144_1668 [Sphingomonas guangdongensis]|uniref:Lipoprotein n=1 Tax=Sphingomonas guangdongensis TaxID=1141890 RepID=A0A285R2J4_9SPHN|nr:hypothetical protein [Sphingomonas guangdongensis]SOB86562.1 hypothetical protein SAMN06297144_1668 [Sphingomonas guangdongensis]